MRGLGAFRALAHRTLASLAMYRLQVIWLPSSQPLHPSVPGYDGQSFDACGRDDKAIAGVAMAVNARNFRRFNCDLAARRNEFCPGHLQHCAKPFCGISSSKVWPTSQLPNGQCRFPTRILVKRKCRASSVLQR